MKNYHPEPPKTIYYPETKQYNQKLDLKFCKTYISKKMPKSKTLPKALNTQSARTRVVPEMLKAIVILLDIQLNCQKS